jgi:hypothetical protein
VTLKNDDDDDDDDSLGVRQQRVVVAPVKAGAI